MNTVFYTKWLCQQIPLQSAAASVYRWKTMERECSSVWACHYSCPRCDHHFSICPQFVMPLNFSVVDRRDVFEPQISSSSSIFSSILLIALVFSLTSSVWDLEDLVGPFFLFVDAQPTLLLNNIYFANLDWRPAVQWQRHLWLKWTWKSFCPKESDFEKEIFRPVLCNMLHQGKRYLQGKPSFDKSKGSHTSPLRSAKSKRSHEANICQKNWYFGLISQL